MARIIAGTRHRHVDTIRSIKFSKKSISQKLLGQKLISPNGMNRCRRCCLTKNLCKTPWVDRWVDIEPPQIPIVARWVDIVQDAPAPIIESKLEPMVTPRTVVMAIITIALTLAIVELLFGGMRSARHPHQRL